MAGRGGGGEVKRLVGGGAEFTLLPENEGPAQRKQPVQSIANSNLHVCA